MRQGLAFKAEHGYLEEIILLKIYLKLSYYTGLTASQNRHQNVRKKRFNPCSLLMQNPNGSQENSLISIQITVEAHISMLQICRLSEV